MNSLQRWSLCPRIHLLMWPFTLAQDKKVYAKLGLMCELILDCWLTKLSKYVVTESRI